MHHDEERRKDGFREGVRAGIGILAAMKDAIEETIDDLRRRGDLSPERAREVMRGAMDRAQSAMDDARERFDLVPRREFEQLRAEVAELRRRVSDLEGAGGATRIPVEEGE
jgi:polyhydroxyalkanoate synthesis regulator phasin